LVLGAIAAVAYADHIVVSISLVYLYILPLAVSAIFLHSEISYSLIAVCILLHDYCSPRYINPGLWIFHTARVRKKRESTNFPSVFECSSVLNLAINTH
jgi:hypothetical protein